jgi:hypothetical protein
VISVIVLNWNGRHLLNGCLFSLRHQTFRDFETILVDNGSTDGSVDYVRSSFPEVRIVALDRNLGFSAGNNRGIMVARGDFIFFLNNDTEVHPDMLEELHRVIEIDPADVGSWAVKMLRWDRRDIIDNCGCAYSAFGAGYQAGSGELNDTYLAQEWVFGASGGAGCHRRSLLDEIGMFDEDFFYNNEDVDLSFRAQLAGYRCHFVPKAIVYHLGSATGGATGDKTIYHIQRNIEWVFAKNMPDRLLWKYVPLHAIYGLAWLAYWAVHGKGRLVFRAKFDALRDWPRVKNKRRHIQSQLCVDLHDLDALIDKKRVLQWWRLLAVSTYLKRLRAVV